MDESRRFLARLPGAKTLSKLEDLAVWSSEAVELLSLDLGAAGATNCVRAVATRPWRLDVAAVAAPERAGAALAEAVRKALRAQAEPTDVRCYHVERLGHVLCLRRTSLASARSELHHLMNLPLQPLLVPEAALPRPGEARSCM